jgi:hypothetical protein
LVSKVRFEKSGRANLQIFDMTGKLVSNHMNISTVNDYQLKLENNKVYVIIVKYDDGTVRTLKTIK